MFSKLAGAVVVSTVGLSAGADAGKNRPVTKVINTIKDMLKQMEKEQEEDESIYEKMACWCENNDKEKTKAIKDAEVRIQHLTTKVSELSSLSAKLNVEIKNTNAEVVKNQEQLAQATEIRRKELAEFNENEKDMLESISAMKAAITVLSKHNTFLQMPAAFLATVKTAMETALRDHDELLKGVLTRTERREALAFISAPGFDSEPTFKQSYAPQSGAIFGILKQMKETFEANLSAAQKDEAAAQKAFDELKAAKEDEIKAGQDQVDTKTDELADTDENLAQSKQDIEDTKNSLSADEEFLMMLKEKCQLSDGEWEQRQKTRSQEMEACSKALAVLSSDEAHDIFTRTFNFMQTAASSTRAEASAELTAAAAKYQNPRLAVLATRVKLDAFTKVKKAIDDMVAALLQEKADEIKKRDYCIEQFHQNKAETERMEAERDDMAAKIENLGLEIESLDQAINGLKSDIAEAKTQMKRASEDREQQNKDFQMTVADQKATVKLIKAALVILQDFYGKKALLQQAGPPPPAGFDKYEKNAQSGGVMGLMQNIIKDAKDMEAQAARDEADAQKAYEEFVVETNAAIDEKNKDIVNKSERKAQAAKDKVKTEGEKENQMMELETLSNTKAELHQQCDFITKNFDLRQSTRDAEVEALRNVKNILSGAK